MSNTPNDPDALSLSPGSGEKKADFSKVTGSADSSADKVRKADFSKVSSSADSSAERVGGGQTYTVEKGDNLSAISKRFYGSPNHWRDIFEANRDQLDNPDLIHPGQTLRIPDRGGDTPDAA